MPKLNYYDHHFRQYGLEYFSDTIDWLWFKAQALAESNLDPEAKSPVGAHGVMQLMPGTSAEMARQLRIDDRPLIPHLNIQMGIAYDRRCWNIFKAEKGIERIRFMLGAYNAGAGHIITAQKLATAAGLLSGRWESIVEKLPEVTGKNATETINYVARIERYYEQLRREA